MTKRMNFHQIDQASDRQAGLRLSPSTEVSKDCQAELRRSPSRTRLWWLATGLLVALLIVLQACGPETTYTQPQTKPLMEAVYASGLIQSGGEYQLTAQAEGILKEQRVREGEAVTIGQVLFVIESKKQEANLANAHKAYALAQKNAGADSPVLREAQNTLAQAQTRYEADSVNYVRYRNLWEAQATAQAAYDAARTAFENAREALAKSQNALQQLKDRLETERLNAYNALQVAEEEAAFYTVKSTIDGLFFQSNKQVGELVRRGEPIATLGSKDGYFANLRVDEQDIMRLQAGQRVLLKIDAYPGKVYEARLTRIYAKIDPRDQSLRVDAALKDTLPAHYTGMALEANIVIREKADALVIPRSLLLPGDSVLVQEADEARRVKVAVGLSTLNEVEITSGITAQTQLLKP